MFLSWTGVSLIREKGGNYLLARDSKLKQKVSGTFRKLHYAECFVRISSYVKSMRYKGHSSLQAIMSALQGDITN